MRGELEATVRQQEELDTRYMQTKFTTVAYLLLPRIAAGIIVTAYTRGRLDLTEECLTSA